MRELMGTEEGREGHDRIFLLFFVNRIGDEDIALRLNRKTSGSEYAITPRKGKVETGVSVTLQPGGYVLKDGDYPDWGCEITITAQ
jgi:hypothetical protein